MNESKADTPDPEGVTHDAILSAVLSVGREVADIRGQVMSLAEASERADRDRAAMKQRLEPIESDRALGAAVRSALAKGGVVLAGFIGFCVGLAQLFDWVSNMKGGGA